MLAANDAVGFTGLKHRGSGANTFSNHRYHISKEGLKKGRWQHVVVVMSDKPDSRVYIDGLPTHVSYGGSDWGGHPGSDLVFGARGGPGKFFQGSIDDIRIYNHALSEAEVKALYEFEKVKE